MNRERLLSLSTDTRGGTVAAANREKLFWLAGIVCGEKPIPPTPHGILIESNFAASGAISTSIV